MNKNLLLVFVFLFLGGLTLITTAFFLPSQTKRLLTATVFSPPSCPFTVGLTPNQIKSDSELSLKQQDILLKLFLNNAVIDSRGVAICREADSLNTCLARFQNLCYQKGQCQEQYDGTRDAIIDSEIQSYLCTLWSQTSSKLFTTTNWPKVTSLFSQLNIPIPDWLTTSHTSYLAWKNQQDNRTTTTIKSSNQTTTTTILPSNSILNITFPKVSQPTLFVYPDPAIIKSIVPKDYDYSPSIERLFKMQPDDSYFNTLGPYGEIAYGQSRQFQAAIVYSDGKYITSLDDPERFVFEENKENFEKEKYYMPPLSQCIVKVNYQVKPDSKPKIISWIYKQITGFGIIKESHEDIVAPDLTDVAAKLWNLKSSMMTPELWDKINFLPALPYFQEVVAPLHYYQWPSSFTDKAVMMSQLHYTKTQENQEIIWKLTDPQIIKDTPIRGHTEFEVEKGICDLTFEQMTSLNEWFKEEYPYLDIKLETKLGFKNEIKDSEIRFISPAESGGKVTNSGLVIAPSEKPNRGIIHLNENGEIYNLPYLDRPYLYLKVADKKQEAKPKTIRIEFLDSQELGGVIRPAGLPSNITPSFTVCDEDNKQMIWLEPLAGQEDIILIFTKNKIIQDPIYGWLYLNFSGDKEDEAIIEGIHLFNPNLKSKITYKYFPNCGYKNTLGKVCFSDAKCNANEQCISTGGILKYCTDVLKNPYLVECPDGYVLAKPSYIYPSVTSHRAYCCLHSSLKEKGGSGCDAGNWIYPPDKCQEAKYSQE